MEPNYNIGDLVVIKETPQSQIKVGDTINYVTNSGNDTVTHRIIEIIEKDGEVLYKTKGDNNASADSDLVSYSQVQGIIAFKISKLGTIISEFVTGIGMFVVLALIIISYVRSSTKEERRIAREDARKLYNMPKYENNN